MAPSPGLEPADALGDLRAGQGDAAVAQLVPDGLVLRQSLLLKGGQSVVAQAGLREGGDLGGQLLGGRARLPVGTTRFASPIRSASPAPTGRPVRIRSMARLAPISRGRRTVPPSMSGTPHRRQKTPNTAFSSTTRRSHHRASSRPPATAWPAMAAITGFDNRSRVGPIGPSPSPLTRLASAGADGLEVGAGAEGTALAPQDGDGGVRVGVEGPEAVRQGFRSLAVHRVAGVGAGEDQGGDGSESFDAYGRRDGVSVGARGAAHLPEITGARGAVGAVAAGVGGGGGLPACGRSAAAGCGAWSLCGWWRPSGELRFVQKAAAGGDAGGGGVAARRRPPPTAHRRGGRSTPPRPGPVSARGAGAATVPPVMTLTPSLPLGFTAVDLDRLATPVLHHVDWQVHQGERWIVLGPNGSGKTTLFELASGYLHPTRGTVDILGRRLGHVDVRRLREHIGLVSTAVAKKLVPAITATDVVVSALHGALEPWWHRYDEPERDRARELLASAGFESIADRPFGVLSDGERQQVLLARALMSDPALLLLDEPAAGLDVGGRERLVASLSRLAADVTAPPTVMITHHVEEIPVGFTHVLLFARDGWWRPVPSPRRSAPSRCPTRSACLCSWKAPRAAGPAGPRAEAESGGAGQRRGAAGGAERGAERGLRRGRRRG